MKGASSPASSCSGLKPSSCPARCGNFEQESPSEKDIKAGEKEFGDVGIENVKSEDKERFEKLNRAIKNKVAKLEIMPKEERAKSIDMSVLKQIIAKPEIKKLFASKGIDVLDLVSSIIA